MKRLVIFVSVLFLICSVSLSQTSNQINNNTSAQNKPALPNPFADIAAENKQKTAAATNNSQPQSSAQPQGQIQTQPQNQSALADMNDYVIKAAESLPRDGSSQYWWPKSGEGNYDGSSKDVFYMGQKVMSGEKEGRSFCCGLTLQIFYMVLNDYMTEKNLKQVGNFTPSDAKAFQGLWFVADKFGDGPGAAMIKYGMGIKINSFEEAKKGDFVQLWRASGSGHSVIFWEAIRDTNGKITGVKYLSTQKSTNGINFNTEEIGGDKGLKLDSCHISRLLPPEQWKK